MTEADQAAPQLEAPPGACDTHIHVYDPKYPIAPTAVSALPAASLDDYRKVQRRLGIERAVIVQPTAYGADNRCTLEGIARHGLDRTRGIAMVTEQVSHTELETLTRGACGARASTC